MVISMKNRAVLKKAVAYIEDHLNEDLTLDKLAKELHYSKFYLARVFAENTDCTIYQYIKRRRLTEAAWKLVQTEQPIMDIALEAQYNSQQAFTLAFRGLYACPPHIYREKGIFYPKQNRIEMYGSVLSLSGLGAGKDFSISGRGIAA